MAHLLANAVRRSLQKQAALVDVSLLNPFVHEWKIRVKILRIFTRSFGTFNTVNMILVDEKGEKIQAIISDESIARSCRNVSAGDWITLTGFKLTLAIDTFRPVPHRFVIRSQTGTVMRKINHQINSKNYFSFATFEEINSGILDPNICVDLIGEVVKVGNEKEDGGPDNNWNEIFFQLQDKEDNILQCRLTGDYANEFFNKWRNCDDDIIICIIRFAKLEVNSGSWVATTAYTCTEILIGFHCSEVTEMRHAVLSRDYMER